MKTFISFNNKRFGIIFVLTLFAIITATSCRLNILRFDTVPHRSIKLTSLFIDESSFPPNIEISELPPSDICKAAPLGSGCKSVEAMGATFYFPVGLAAEDIYRYASVEAATEDFSRLREDEFEGLTHTKWSKPTELSFISSTASHYYVDCTTDRSVEICSMLAQYSEFVIHFRAQMVDLNYYDFNNLIQSVDAKVNSVLAE